MILGDPGLYRPPSREKIEPMALTLAEKTLFFGACFYCLKAPKTENLTCLQHVLKFKDSRASGPRSSSLNIAFANPAGLGQLSFELSVELLA